MIGSHTMAYDSPVKYVHPTQWIKYDPAAIMGPLIEAKAAVASLSNVPYQKVWAERLQEMQLKQEVAGTSRIEGAEFTENELDAALNDDVDASGMTRSQRQARAAVFTYKWIAALPKDRPVDADLVLEIHRRIVTGCDDDHCEPGAIRSDGNNVVFGSPKHRGAEGGKECEKAFEGLIEALNQEFQGHDILIRGLAFHYHIGAMHPFLDGNGRTARAVEALMLQRSGLRQTLFIALSNYYYDEKPTYLKTLAEVKEKNDLTPFLVFGLTGIALQCRRLLQEINLNISKALFRDMAAYLFNRLQSNKRRIIAQRQLAVINFLLERGETEASLLHRQLGHLYMMKDPWSAFVRDINSLIGLGAATVKQDDKRRFMISLRLDWPERITETAFFDRAKSMTSAKTFSFLNRDFDDEKAKDAT